MALVGRLCRSGDTLLSPSAGCRFRPSAADRGVVGRGRDPSSAATEQVSGTFMPQKVRIALDAMGGDVGAAVVVPGAAVSLARHPGSEFLLFGDHAKIEPELAKHPALKAASRVFHTDVA